MVDAGSLMQPRPISSVRRQFMRASDTFDEHAEVYRVIGAQLQERLELLAIAPLRVLDLGCRSGFQLAALERRYPDAQVIGLDPAPARPAPVTRGLFRWPLRSRQPAMVTAADPHHLPLADASVDLVISNLLLPFCHSPHQVFREVARVLAPGGAFMFTSAGVDTLKEYRAWWARIDCHLHAFGLLDMHELGDSMLAAGFAAPVLDRQNMQVEYPHVEALQAELQQLGAGNLAAGRRSGLMAPEVRNSLARFSAGAPLSISFELVHGHAWKGELPAGSRPGVADESGGGVDGEYSVSLDSLRRALRREG